MLNPKLLPVDCDGCMRAIALSPQIPFVAIFEWLVLADFEARTPCDLHIFVVHCSTDVREQINFHSNSIRSSFFAVSTKYVAWASEQK